MLLDVAGDLRQIPTVFLRYQDGPQSPPQGGQELLLQPPDRQDLSTQRDLARHRHVRAHGDAGQHGHQGRAHADTRARAVLRGRTLRHVDVDVVLLVEVRVHAEALAAAPHHRHRRLDRLLHHVAQLARVDQLALSGHHGGLDGQEVPTDLGPGEPRHFTDPVLRLHLPVTVALDPEIGLEIARTHRDLAPTGGPHQLLHHLARDLRDLALQVAYPRLSRIEAHDVADRAVADPELGLRKAVVLDLLRDEITGGDVELLVLRVAREPDDLHPVEQRRRDVERVRRGDEHHLGQVVVDLQVMVVEGIVLLRIQDLQQRRGGVSPKIHRHLVDFVEQIEGVADTRLRQVLDDLPRKRPNVRAPVATDLRLVPHAPQRHAHELAIGGARDRASDGRLAHPRWPDQAEDRPLELLDALLHRQVLENALLHLLQSVVVLVQHRLGRAEVEADLAPLLPGHVHEPIDVVPDDGRLGRHRGHHLQLVQLAHGLVPGLAGHTRLLDLLAELLDLVRSLVQIPQFLLDGLHLLVQVVLALALLHLLLHAATDALFHLQQVDLGLEQSDQSFHPLARILDLEDLLLLIELHRQVRGHRVRQPPRRLDGREGRQDLGRNLPVQLHVLLELREHRAAEGLTLPPLRLLRLQDPNLREEVLVLPEELHDPRPFDPLHEHLDRAVGELQQLKDRRQRSDSVDVVGGRVVLCRALLGNQQDLLVVLHRPLEGPDGLVAPHEQGDDHVRVDDDVPQGQYRTPQCRLHHLGRPVGFDHGNVPLSRPQPAAACHPDT